MSQPRSVTVEVEVARGGRIKWGADGGVDFLSPVPCPFNYGSVPGLPAPDGDPADALVLGPRIARGEQLEARVVGVVRFVDQGRRDDKLVCLPVGAGGEPTTAEVLLLRRFFGLYALVKQLGQRLRGRRGATRFEGVSWLL